MALIYVFAGGCHEQKGFGEENLGLWIPEDNPVLLD